MLAAAGVNAPAETPVAESATRSVESAASLITDNAPLVIPASWGTNETVKLTFCPAANVNGVDSPLTLNPEPATFVCEMLMFVVPEFVKTSVRWLVVPTDTFPKLMPTG